MSFRPGQFVECIDASGAPELRRGGVYSIAAFCRCHKPPGVRLVEVLPEGRYCGFEGERFRAITERSTQTGFAELHRILADHKAPVREKALSSLSSFRVTGTNT